MSLPQRDAPHEVINNECALRDPMLINHNPLDRETTRLWQSSMELTEIIARTLSIDPIRAECLAGILITFDRKGFRGCETLRERIRPAVQLYAQRIFDVDACSNGLSRVVMETSDPQEAKSCAG
ncbi:MAG: hypothetical protein ACYDDA_13390 [Acidiferrobacteraceae bacterium]